jgi:hypothetical protein
MSLERIVLETRRSKLQERAAMIERGFSLGFFFASIVSLTMASPHYSFQIGKISFAYETWALYFIVLSFASYPFGKFRTRSLIRHLWREIALSLIALCAFFLSCLALLNYYYDCPASSCGGIHYVLVPVFHVDSSLVFPILKLFPAPYSWDLSVQCAYLFVIMLVSFALLRLEQGMLNIYDSVIMGLAIITIFEAGLFYLNRSWWTMHITTFGSFPLTVITNEELFIGVSIGLVVAIGCRKLAQNSRIVRLSAIAQMS